MTRWQNMHASLSCFACSCWCDGNSRNMAFKVDFLIHCNSKSLRAMLIKISEIWKSCKLLCNFLRSDCGLAMATEIVKI